MARRRARIKALHEKKSLNAVFQELLEQYAPDNAVTNFRKLMKKFKHVHPGKQFTRDELNER